MAKMMIFVRLGNVSTQEAEAGGFPIGGWPA